MVRSVTALLIAVGGLIGALTKLGVIGGTSPGKPAISMSPSRSVWDSNTFGSHWHGIVAWQTSGTVKSCKLHDDHGTAPVRVDPKSDEYPIGSYAHTVPVVQVTVACKGSGGTGSSSINVQQPAAPHVQITVGRAESVWLDPAQTHWQIVLTWKSDGVDCAISDDVGKQWLHKDPRGETAGPYGDFSRATRGVGVRFKCLDVAFVPFFKSIGVRRPRLRPGGNV